MKIFFIIIGLAKKNRNNLKKCRLWIFVKNCWKVNLFPEWNWNKKVLQQHSLKITLMDYDYFINKSNLVKRSFHQLFIMPHTRKLYPYPWCKLQILFITKSSKQYNNKILISKTVILLHGCFLAKWKLSH